MIEVIENTSIIEVTHNDQTVEIIAKSSPIIEISPVGKQGFSPTLPDVDIINKVSDTNKTFTYTGERLDLITYSNSEGATNHTKTLNYITFEDIEVVSSIVQSFYYDGKLWTYTKILTYLDGGAVSSISRSLTKE